MTTAAAAAPTAAAAAMAPPHTLTRGPPLPPPAPGAPPSGCWAMLEGSDGQGERAREVAAAAAAAAACRVPPPWLSGVRREAGMEVGGCPGGRPRGTSPEALLAAQG